MVDTSLSMVELFIAFQYNEIDKAELVEGGNSMQGIKNMLLGIAIMVASIAFYSVYDNDMVAVIIAIIGLCVSIYGYFKREK